MISISFPFSYFQFISVVNFGGFIVLDDRVEERLWTVDEILLLSTAAELLASTLQRWQAEEYLRTMNDRLEQQVKNRTSELSDTVVLLQKK